MNLFGQACKMLIYNTLRTDFSSVIFVANIATQQKKA